MALYSNEAILLKDILRLYNRDIDLGVSSNENEIAFIQANFKVKINDL